MTTKYGDLLLRQKYADLKALAQDHDLLAGPLDNKSLADEHRKHMRAILKLIDGVITQHRKEYPGAPPLDDEEELEEGNADTPVGPTESLEDEEGDEDEQEGSEFESPEEEFGQEDVGIAAPAEAPIEEAMAAVQGDAPTMDNPGVGAPTNNERELEEPTPEEALAGMQLGRDNDLGGAGKDLSEDEKGLFDWLRQRREDRYVAEKEGEQEAIEKVRDQQQIKESDAVFHSTVAKAREIGHDQGTAEYYGHRARQAHESAAGYLRFGRGDFHEGHKRALADLAKVHEEMHAQAPKSMRGGKIKDCGDIDKEVRELLAALGDGSGSAALMDGPDFLSAATVNEEQGYERVKTDTEEKAILSPRPPNYDGPGMGMTMPHKNDLHPIGTRVMTPGGEGEYSHHSGGGRHLVEHEGGDSWDSYEAHEITPIKDEKAIVRMVQVKEHMRKLPQRKKLTCPECGSDKGANCDCAAEGDPFDYDGLDFGDHDLNDYDEYGDPEEEAEEFGKDEEYGDWLDDSYVKALKPSPFQHGDRVKPVAGHLAGAEGHIIDTHEDAHGTTHTVHFPKSNETYVMGHSSLEHVGPAPVRQSVGPTAKPTASVSRVSPHSQERHHQSNSDEPLVRQSEPLRYNSAQEQRTTVAEATHARNTPKDRGDFLARKRAVSRAMAATEEWNTLNEDARESLTPLVAKKPSSLARRGVPPPLPARRGPPPLAPTAKPASGPPPLPARGGPPPIPHKFKVGDTVRTRNGDVVTVHGTHLDREGKPTYSVSRGGKVVGHPERSGAALLYESNFTHHDPKNEEHVAAATTAKQSAAERRAVREARQHREQQRSGFGASGGWLAPGATDKEPAKPTEALPTPGREQNPRQRRQFVDRPGAASGMTRRQVSAGGWLGPNKPKFFDDVMGFLGSIQNKSYLTEEDKFLAFHYGKMLDGLTKSNHFHKDVDGDGELQSGQYPGQAGHGEMLDNVYDELARRAPQKSLDEAVKELLDRVNGKASPSYGKPTPALPDWELINTSVEDDYEPDDKGPKNSPVGEETQSKSLDDCAKFFFRMAQEKNFGSRHREEAKEVAGVLESIRGAVAKRGKGIPDPKTRGGKRSRAVDRRISAENADNHDLAERRNEEHMRLIDRDRARMEAGQTTQEQISEDLRLDAGMVDAYRHGTLGLPGHYGHNPQLEEHLAAQREEDPKKSYDLNSLLKDLRETLVKK